MLNFKIFTHYVIGSESVADPGKRSSFDCDERAPATQMTSMPGHVTQSCNCQTTNSATNPKTNNGRRYSVGKSLYVCASWLWKINCGIG